jgi:hypothetical protein
MQWFSKLLNTTVNTIYVGDFNWELLYPRNNSNQAVTMQQPVDI